MTGLAPDFAAENVGFFTAPYGERAKLGKPVIDRANTPRALNPGHAAARLYNAPGQTLSVIGAAGFSADSRRSHLFGTTRP
jgi:hypothetical protein